MNAYLPQNRLVRHLLFWVAVALYFFVPQWIYPDYLDTVGHYFFDFDYQQSPYFLLILFVYTLGIGMGYAYGFLRWVRPPLASGRYVVGVGRYVALTVAICYGFRGLKGLHVALLDPLLRGTSPRPFDHRHLDGLFFNQVYIHEYSTILLALAAYAFFTNWLRQQREAERLAGERTETELRLLKTQINPDFLLDSLHCLTNLIEQRDQQAPGFVVRLAQLLRYFLYENRANQVPLRTEWQMLEHLVWLQRTTHPNDLDVSLTHRGCTDVPTVAPLLFLSVADYAFRQVRAPADDLHWLSFDVAVGATCLTLKVIVGQSAPTDYTTKLANLRKQLYFQYGDDHTLHLVADTDALILTLTVPVHVPKAVAVPYVVLPHETPLPPR